jgi:hypothetical protein
VDAIMSLDAGRLTAMQAAQEAAAKAQHDKAFADLQTEWGAAYESKMHLMKTAVAKSGISPEKLAGLQERFGNDADLVRMLANLGAKFSEGGTPPAGAEMGGALTPVEARSRMTELIEQQIKMNKYDAKYQTLEADIQKLAKMATHGQT